LIVAQDPGDYGISILQLCLLFAAEA
jgi:hypothetical protein